MFDVFSDQDIYRREKTLVHKGFYLPKRKYSCLQAHVTGNIIDTKYTIRSRTKRKKEVRDITGGQQLRTSQDGGLVA
jgi:hypothetical protein